MATAGNNARANAAECLPLAQDAKAKAPEDRARQLQMAQSWRELADKLMDRPEK